jgi:molecular chaperone GrpE
MKDKNKKIKQEGVNPEVEVLKAQLARTLADYDNLRKRSDEERVNFIKYASKGVVSNLLPVLDTFENAQIHLKDAGLAIAIGQFKEVLKQEGLEEIKPNSGESFDENLMEVTETVEGAKDDDGKVAEVIMSGWRFADGQVVRHARVKVFSLKN